MVYDAYDKYGEKIMYLSGIHVIQTKYLCDKYLKRFKRQDNKVIVECEAIGCIKKPRGRLGVLLVDSVIILKEV